MNNEQQELLDEAHENYWSNAKHNNLDCLVKQEEGSFLVEMRFYYKEEFINKCKTDTDFSERWGLKIEEQTIFEQVDQNNPVLKGSTALYPRKLITVTYKDKTCLNVN
jgi:hypothetical protein